MSTPRSATRRPASNRGLTLIELVVVLTILIALGSLLVPVVNNVFTRAHVSTCSSNIPEIAGMLLRKAALEGDFGDNWSSGVAADTVAAGTSVNGGNVEAATAGDVAALAAIGITDVWDHQISTTAATNDDYLVTFNRFPVEEDIDTDTVLIVLTAAQQTALDLPAGRYVWLGIDKEWDGIGVDTPEPPTHFGDTEGAYPQDVYSRFGAIFRTVDGTDVLDSAEFVQVSYSLDGSAFETADNHIAIYWDEVF